MKNLLVIALLSIAFTSCKKDDNKPSLKSSNPGDKVAAGWVIYKSADGHGVMMCDSINNNFVTWFAGNRFCEDLVYNGYENWRLPTLKELQYMYENAYKKGIGNFYMPTDEIPYWGTYVEDNPSYSWVVYFSPTEARVTDTISTKANAIRVRAVRDF